MQILGANAGEVSKVLKDFASDLTSVIGALENLDSAGSLAILGDALSRGNRGVEQIPGKHGTRNKHYEQITVMIDDKPGQLAKLLTEIGEIGINLEDLSLEHSPGAQIGLVELSVLPSLETKLVAALQERGWRIAG
jgi:prephenate dehydrogenase